MNTSPLFHLFLFLLVPFATACADDNTNDLNQPTAPAVEDHWKQPFFASEETYQADQVNPPYAENGGRSADQMIIYTAAYGDHTNTNPWGVEAIIEDGIVVNVGGNDSPIPSSGMVLSGHGKAANWINDHLEVGDKVEKNGRIIRVISSENSLVNRAQVFIRNGKSRSAEIKHPSINPEHLTALEQTFNTTLKAFKAAKQAGDSSKVQQLAEESLLLGKDYFYYTFPALENDERSAWLEIHGMSQEELEAVFKDLAEIGFNAVCPEVIYRGWSIFPDAPNGLNQYPDFIGRDPMQEMIELGEKYNIKVIPWVWVYFIGVDHFPDLINNRREWLAVSRQGKHPSVVEAGFYYFCPSRDEVKDYWLQIYQHMHEKYQIKDLQLDYIRYPGEPWTNDYCYCEVCRQKFAEQNDGVDPLDISPEANPQLWVKWDKYRQANVNRFVEAVSDLLPGVNISAAVVPDREASLKHKKQDWGKWLDNNWLNTVYIMSYSSDVDLVACHIDYMVAQTDDQHRGIAGLGPFQGMKPEILVKEIDLGRLKQLDGTCLFLYNALTEEQKYALRKGPYRK
ncbi:family 10 glycosylhydrolase [uncultured Sunxiuqinia sp.]|uniref:family 10 glycosylhydrolase n=1 Tax=uncultured Sunxiuqinia sp. TaxID=1573825 RepID=UPI0026050C9A|nr:family 10 glycosylhydrolase [uncultured Sunxiuqinia sp.]